LTDTEPEFTIGTMNVLVVVSVLITRGVIELRDVAVLIILGITKSGSATLSITRGVGRRELVQRDHMLGGGGGREGISMYIAWGT